METADGGTHENQVQASAFLQFAQEQCVQQYIEEPTRKNNILDVFLTNNDQLTRQIIITETSMSDHNIIQIERNIKIVEEKQNHQIKKSNFFTLSCRTGSALVWHSEVARSRLTQCSKYCDLQLALQCAIRGAQGVLPCVGWGVRPVKPSLTPLSVAGCG